MTSAPTRLLKRAAQEDGTVSPPPIKRQSAASVMKQKAVANFFKPASQKEAEPVVWTVRDNSLLAAKFEPANKSHQPLPSGKKRKIAAFDFDSTLIMTKSGNRFPKDGDDWKWWHRDVPGKLRGLVEDGYIVTIVSNQAGISLKTDSKSLKTDKKRLSDFKQKASNVFTQLDIPICLYAATEKDGYRKPRVGMWRALLEDHALTEDMIDLDASIFVGDAAGRAAEGSRKKDHSCSDRDFATNISIPFRTPEEYFLNEPAKPFQRAFDPAQYTSLISTLPSTTLFTKKHPLDLVLFVGSPGSGKSTFFAKNLLPLGYHRVNQDLLKTRDKCVQAATEHLKSQQPVAVDNTNRDRATRKVWVDLAKRFGVPVRCVWFTAEPAVCEHNNVVRALNEGVNPEKRVLLPGSAFPMYRSAFERPELEEGFEDVTKVEFVFEGTEEERRVWGMYWV